MCGYFGKEGRRHTLEEEAIGRGGPIQKVGQEVSGCVPQGGMGLEVKGGPEVPQETDGVGLHIGLKSWKN